MKKLIHYILIGIMLNWNVAVFADDDVEGCKWEVVEETEQYLQEQCIGVDGQYSARIRSKPIDNSIVYVKTEKKDANPIQKYRDRIKYNKIKQMRNNIENENEDRR